MVSLAGLIMASSMVIGQAQAADLTVPKDVLNELERLIGDWKVEGEMGGEPMTFTISHTWAPGKHAVLWTGTFSGLGMKATGCGMYGWDTANKVIRSSEYWTNGYNHHRTFVVKGKGLWEGDSQGGDNEGKHLNDKVKFEFKGPDTFIGSFLPVGNGPDKGPDLVLEFKRVKK